MRNSTKGELAILGAEFGDTVVPVLGVLILAVLILVAVWYFLRKVNWASWLDKTSSDFAGGISNGLYNVSQSGGILAIPAQKASGPVNNWLFDLTSWAGQWDLGSNPADVPSNPGVTPYFGG